MEFCEFIEFVARMAEMASLPPICHSEEVTATWPYEKLYQLPLHVKIESLIMVFIKKGLPAFMR